MEQYIKKSTLVEEIERIKNTEYNGNSISGDVACCALDMTIDAINAIEVKETDLEKESLTWEDIRELYILFAEVDAEIEFCKYDIKAETIGYYQEVLKRFKALKGE